MRNPTQWQSPEPFLWTLLRNNLPVVLFLLVAAGGMLGVYWFFSPEGDASAEAIAALGEADLPVAPIFKPVPARPVTQRFPQTPGPMHVAVIAGHMNHDAGAVCEDGLTEADVNLKVAHEVVRLLQDQGTRAEVFAEFDPRLQGYAGTALVSIHADSCDYFNDLATGFKISGSTFTDSGALSICMQNEYQAATRLPFHANTITEDMRNYHAFREIAGGVPAVIIEVGFLNLDRELLTMDAAIPAAGIANGVLCFMQARQTVAIGSSP